MSAERLIVRAQEVITRCAYRGWYLEIDGQSWLLTPANRLVKIDRNSVRMNTGARDGFGVYIYEGDVLTDDDGGRLTVEWDDNASIWCIYNRDGDLYGSLCDCLEENGCTYGLRLLTADEEEADAEESMSDSVDEERFEAERGN